MPVKERPLLFSAPMVNAILAGRKTQTRRIIKPQPTYEGLPVTKISPLLEGSDCHKTGEFMFHHPEYDRVVRSGYWCPFGKPGYHLWIRETHAIFNVTEDRLEAGVGYRADHPYGGDLSKGDGGYNFHSFEGFAERADVERMVNPDRWRPSIFMPRWASRITLRLKSVRVERLQDISEADAIAEGIERHDSTRWRDYGLSIPGAVGCLADPRDSFQSLWESLHGAGSWQANPWLWVVEFERVNAAEVQTK